MSKVTFNNKSNPFSKALKEKVDGYFQRNNLNREGSTKLLLKALIQISSALILYVVLVFFTPPTLISIVLCVLLGLNLGALGFNIMHEGGHQTFSEHKWINSLSAYILNGLGGNIHIWKLKHNIAHHTYTNIEGLDSDIEIGPLMRLNDEQPRYWIHRFQHIYWVLLYGATYLMWIFYGDFEKYFTGRISKGMTVQKFKLNEHFIFWISKITYVGIFLLLPVLLMGILKVLVGYAIITFVTGLFIAIVFQLAHIVKDTSFPQADIHTNKIEQEWAIHQVTTTANFGTKSKLLYWLLGGLNFQVEHHLFPRISHIHYPQISLLVKETCQQFNIAYIEYPTLQKALAAHVFHLKRLGKQDNFDRT